MIYELLCLTFALAVSRSAAQTLTVISNCIEDGATVILRCHTSNFSDPILFYLGTSNKGGCTSGVCGTIPRYNLTQSGTFTDLKISAYDHSNDGGNWTCSYRSSTSNTYTVELGSCKSDAKSSLQVIIGAVIDAVWSAVEGPIKYLIGYLLWCLLCCWSCCMQCCMPFTFIVALAWCYYLSRRYVYNGRVVYGIQLVIVAAISQLITIISAVVVLTEYEEQNESYAIIIMLLMMPVCAFLAEGTYLLCKACCGQKEWTHTKFKDMLMDHSLSNDYGINFNAINKDKIWFKVWAKDDVLLTLVGNHEKPFLYIIMGYGKRHRKFYSKSSIPVVTCDDVLGTDYKYRIFYLTCEKHCVTVVRVLNGKEETVLKWPDTNCPEPLDIDRRLLNISDIRISNYMRDIKDKDDSVETADTADTADTKSQTGTPGEWIFFIREGDGLHEDDDDSRCSKNLTLFLVVLIPIAWIVMPILFLKKCKMPCAKETKNSKDTNGKGEEEGQPNDAMITAENVWINTPIGRKMPDLPAIESTEQTDAGPEDTKQKKKKKKSKNRKKDSSRNDIQQSQEDTEKNTVQTVAD